ncbi:MAG: phage holin family protein [Chloroflexi bacterium]|nr:phage holin family protein [Chloroflexota bacterium]
MKPSVAVFLRLALRFVVIWLIETVALLYLATRFPGVLLEFPQRSPAIILSAVLMALALSAINILIQPLITMLRLPLNIITIGLSAVVVNSVTLRLAASRLAGFDIEPFFPNAVWAALLMALISTVLTALIALDDEYAFYQFVAHVLARHRGIRQVLKAQTGPCGMVIVQIDGLSSQRLRYAVQHGYMPTMKAMLSGGSYECVTFDCGLPSQTSACQAGILYGNNDNIPAFRWYDKHLQRMIVSNHPGDANLINNMVSTGAGLLRGGSSINNLINGDAAKSLLTLSTLAGQSRVPTIRALDDLSSFWFNPYTFTRTLASTLGDMLAEIAESLRQQVRNERPRLDRLFTGQIFLRMLTNIFLRDLSAYVVMLDIIRGVPIIYTTFMGYDQVAHHAGPDSIDALRTLRGLDKQLRHITQTLRRLAPHPYNLYVLSDHGQSFGATFKQRYRISLRDLVDTLTNRNTPVEQAYPEGDKMTYTSALISELHAADRQLAVQPNMRFRRAVMRQAARTLERQTLPPDEHAALVHTPSSSRIVVCVSGNLAHLYFDFSPDKVALGEIESRHPELVRGLVMHDGIGFVIGYDDDGNVVMLGKYGARNLSTGTITGTDPLSPYSSADIRATQLLRIAEFGNAGDLILNSTLYPDGTVASFEELIGVHGGLGGQQTDAFIVYPADADIRNEGIINAAQVFQILDRHRNGCAEQPASATERRDTPGRS